MKENPSPKQGRGPWSNKSKTKAKIGLTSAAYLQSMNAAVHCERTPCPSILQPTAPHRRGVVPDTSRQALGRAAYLSCLRVAHGGRIEKKTNNR